MPKADKPSHSINKGADRNEAVNPSYRIKKEALKTADEYVEGILAGDRAALSKTITLLESMRAEHRKLGRQVLNRLLPHTGHSVRIGITGVPGVGKSTFIEEMGKRMVNAGKKLAVLTIDPSSSLSKGSILGDKTRMAELSSLENAYIRPSPAAGTLGGVALATREAMLLCEAAGYNLIFIETVGVGQSEIAVHQMTDLFLLLMLPGAGDELQGMKRGIMEMADLIAINKAEEGTMKAAKQAKKEYENALALFPKKPSGWKPRVRLCSALEANGLDVLMDDIDDFLAQVRENRSFNDRRSEQKRNWLHETVRAALVESFYNTETVQKELERLERDVADGEQSPYQAAEQAIDTYLKGKKSGKF